MNKILALLLLLPALTYAQPKYLEGAEISIKLKSGKVYKYNTKYFAVVSRKKVKKEEIKKVPVVKKKEINVKNIKWNSMSFYAGGGPDGVGSNSQGTVYVKKEPVLALGFSQRIDEEYHLEMIGITNETFLLGLKYEF